MILMIMWMMMMTAMSMEIMEIGIRILMFSGLLLPTKSPSSSSTTILKVANLDYLMTNM